MPVGQTTLDFGAFPGKTDASVAVAAPTILAGSKVEAQVRLEATVDHSADEHMLETIEIFAGDVQAGVGFTVYGITRWPLAPACSPPPMPWGRFSVDWVWV